MKELSGKSWSKINDFLISVSSVQNVDELNSRVMQEIHMLLPFENSGNIIEMDAKDPFNSRIKNFIQSDKKWSDLFNDHFHKIATPPSFDKNILFANLSWLKKNNKDEYINNFLIPQAINCSAGFMTFDTENNPAYIFIFNRSKSEPAYSKQELSILKVLQVHICNYFRMLCHAERITKLPVMQIELEKHTRLLSQRECEIIGLLFRRKRPVDIAAELKISILTVRKHLQNIYDKLQVSGRQQLLERVNSDFSNSARRDE